MEDVHSIFWFGWALAKKQFVDAGGMAENARDVLECRVRFVLVLVAVLTCRVEYACESRILGSTLFGHPVLAGSRFATSR